MEDGTGAGTREMIREMIEEMMQDRRGGPVGEAPSPGPDISDSPGDREQLRGDMMGEDEGPRGREDSRRMHRFDRDRPHGMMRGHGKMMGEHGARMRIIFAIMDENGDGALSIEEVNEFHRRIFNALDQNGDDRVTPEEIAGFFHGRDN